MRKRVHLIEKRGLIEAIPGSPEEYESGFWSIQPTTARQLIGGDIYFHKAQQAYSFFGGVVLGFRIATTGEYQGRVIFRFRADAKHRNVSAGEGGWSVEKKIVL